MADEKKGILQSKATWNVVGGAGISVGFVVALFQILRHAIPDLIWDESYDKDLAAVLLFVLIPFFSRLIAHFRGQTASSQDKVPK